MGRMFGTDGVRGIANVELTAELAYRLGRAGAYVLTEKAHKPTIVVGMDTRISGDMLESALIAGICSVGAHAICVGIVPTPAVAYLTRLYNADAGVVISASHNPVEYNGIKFFDKNGYKLPDEVEDRIEELIAKNLVHVPSPTGPNLGIREYKKDGILEYMKYAKSVINHDLKGLKVALDCAEGASFIASPQVFKELGAEVHVIHNNPTGININKKCGSTHMEELCQFTVDMGCDIGLAFDGDADRCLAVDEKGNVINGDFMMTICAKDMHENGLLSKDTLVVTVMSNMGLDIACREHGINIVKTKVGDRYVLEEMAKDGYGLGGEQSGHIIFLEHNTTGDGLVTALKLASILKRSERKMSELTGIMKELPQVLVNAKVTNDKKHVYTKDTDIINEIEAMEKALEGKGRVLIRPSGTEPLVRVMLEGENQEEIEKMATKLAILIEERSN
jgi:phosphoglucosamine mutase